MDITLKQPSFESFEVYQAAQRTARLMTICCVVFGVICLSLTGLLIALLPLKEVQPMLVTIKDKGEQIVRIEPVERNVKAIEQLKETLTRQYVQLRETIDLQTEKIRWKQVALMSSNELAREFQDQMNPESRDSPMAKRMQERTTRSVQILASTSLAPSAPDVYQVEWISEDVHKGQVVGSAHWTTTMTVSLEERTFEYEDQYINPIGFTVTHYTVARKNELQQLRNKEQ